MERILLLAIYCREGTSLHARVLFVTSEIDDFVRVGGLAAVSAALPRAMRACCDIRILLPGYSSVLRGVQGLEIIGTCPGLARLPEAYLARAATEDGMKVYVLVCPALYEREGTPYGTSGGADWPDNAVRFARLSLAAAQIAMGQVDAGWAADLLHANDWPSALAPAYLKWMGSSVPSLLTIHNLAFQGLFGRDVLGAIGAPDSAFDIDGVEFYGKVSFLKGGLVYADQLTTVSETYAREITTPEFGCGLHGVLKRRAANDELSGIVNGIDESWDASTGVGLAAPFASGDWTGKQANADHLRHSFGLGVSNGPLFGLVARLVHQKGVDLVLQTAQTIVQSGGQIVVMGKGEPALENAMRSMRDRNPQSVGVHIGFEDNGARRIFAGSDFTLMPSRFEPCGLSQMYAQRLGSLPIGRNTGGLAETIKDGDTGFLFSEPSAVSFLGAICRAFSIFGRETSLNRMRESAMAQNFSWSRSAQAYQAVYGGLYAKAARPLAGAA